MAWTIASIGEEAFLIDVRCGIANLKDRGQTTEDSEKTLEVGGAALRQAQGLEVGGKTKEVSGPLSIVREA